MSESCCRKKQIEKSQDGEISRCVNPKSQVFLSVISDSFCGACPVKVACAKSKNEVPTEHRAAPILPDFPYCEHRISKGFEAKCGVTGLPVTSEQCNRCDAETRERVATLGDKFVGYAGAIQRWVAAGRPTRTEQQIKDIFENHCNKCEMYDQEKHSCKNCGCSLALTGNPLTNKLAMGTEKCPLGRW
jgi:hypothetical protein